MKKITFILFLIPVVAFSQSSLGIKGGATFSNLSNYSGYQFHLGPNFGLIYTKNFNHFQATIEPSYNVKGYDIDGLFTDLNGNSLKHERIKTKLNYLEMPVTFGWVPLSNKIIFGINAGLTPSLLLSAKLKYPNNYNYSINNLRTFNLDITAGTKFGIKITDKAFVVLNIRYGLQLLGQTSYHNSVRCYYFSPFIEIGRKF